MSTESLYKLILNKENNRKMALCFEGTELSFSDIRNQVEIFLKELEVLSVESGDLIIDWGANSPCGIVSLLAAEKLGVYFLPLGEKTPLKEIEHLFKNFKKIFIFHNFRLIDIFHSNQEYEFKNKMGLVLRTSGSTGKPSPVIRSFPSLAENALIASNYQKMNSHTKSLVSLAMCHTGGLNMQSLPTLVAGGCLIMSRKLGRYSFFKLQSEKPTHSILVPSQIRWYFKDEKSRHKLSLSLQTIVTGSTPVLENDWRVLEKLFDRNLNVYGMSEVGPFVIVSEEFKKPIDGSLSYIGNAIEPYECNVIKGEITVTGPCIGERIRTKKMPSTIKTGDAGVQTPDGIYYCGRIERFLEVSGHKFSPIEIEICMQEHWSVESVAIIGENHALWGQVPTAYVVGDENQKDALVEYLRSRLSPHKLPRNIYYVENLPRTDIQKVNYNAI